MHVRSSSELATHGRFRTSEGLNYALKIGSGWTSGPPEDEYLHRPPVPGVARGRHTCRGPMPKTPTDGGRPAASSEELATDDRSHNEREAPES